MRRKRGINALELLMVIVVVCSVVAIGVPRLHRGADTAVLDSNLQSLGSLVKQMVVEGYSTAYRGAGEGDPQVHVSAVLEEELKQARAHNYVNPYTGKNKGTAVINAHQVPLQQGFVAPAVLITDSGDWQYPGFVGLPLAERRMMAGTLVVAFDSGTRTINVYFVDQEGRGSPSAVSVPTGPMLAANN